MTVSRFRYSEIIIVIVIVYGVIEYGIRGDIFNIISLLIKNVTMTSCPYSRNRSIRVDSGQGRSSGLNVLDSTDSC